MKTLLKLAILIMVLLILAFSENPIISNARNFVLGNGKKVYDKGVEASKIATEKAKDISEKVNEANKK